MAGNKTPIWDYEKGDFKTSNGVILTAEDEAAIEQIILKAQATARGVYLIYANIENADLDHKYGSDAVALLAQADVSDEVRDSELKRAVKEAIIYDPLITDVYDVALYQETADDGSPMHYVDFKVATVYDSTVEVKGVALNG